MSDYDFVLEMEDDDLMMTIRVVQEVIMESFHKKNLIMVKTLMIMILRKQLIKIQNGYEDKIRERSN